MNYFCEICGNNADIHHIIHKSQGGLDFALNYKYLCPIHHRGKNGPHKNIFTDLEYKLEMQENLYKILKKQFYSLDELSEILSLNKNFLKKITKNLKLYKEGYHSKDIIFQLMGKKYYSQEYIEDLYIENLVFTV